MKVSFTNYEHSDNGIAINVVPETPIEEELLRGVWKHGHLEVVYGPTYSIRAYNKPKEDKQKD